MRACVHSSGIATGADRTMVAFAHGLALAVMVSALGAVSGGHFNPAVTMALWLASRMTGRRALAYIMAGHEAHHVQVIRAKYL